MRHIAELGDWVVGTGCWVLGMNWDQGEVGGWEVNGWEKSSCDIKLVPLYLFVSIVPLTCLRFHHASSPQWNETIPSPGPQSPIWPTGHARLTTGRRTLEGQLVTGIPDRKT